MNPPERAVVFSFDERTQVQVLDRTQLSLPMKKGRGATMIHDDTRNGTTDRLVAMNVATGEVLHDTKARHSSKEVLDFFKFIDANVSKELDVHVVLDNLSAHKAESVATWLAHPTRARWHLHVTPTSSSWLNLVWVQPTHQPSCEEGNVLVGRATERRDWHLDEELERRPPTVHLEETRRRDHHQG